MIDIVLPEGNENELIEMAVRLGYSELCLAYDITNAGRAETTEDKRIKLSYGIICKPKDARIARQKADIAICEAVENNRALFEDAKPDIVFNLENSPLSDFIYNRNSGLDQVSCKAANKNKVAVAFSVGNMLNAGNKARLFGRITQNITFCRKYKAKMIIASFAREPHEMRAPNDLIGMFTVLGMNPNEAKKALNNAGETIKENRHKKSKDYIGEGMRVI